MSTNTPGRNDVPPPSEHPDRDLLADLAADELPNDLARRVEEHVMACQYCADLLGEAERIRYLLQQAEPEPMPDAVLMRLERALADARWEDSIPGRAAPGPNPISPRPASGLPTSPDFPATDATVPGFPAFRPTSSSGMSANAPRSGGRSGPPATNGSEAGDKKRRIVRSQPPTSAMTMSLNVNGQARPASRLSRMSESTHRARRQALEEQRADKPSRVRPILMGTAAVLAVLVVLGGGTLGWKALRGDSSSTDTASGSSAASSAVQAPLLAPVRSTNTNYARKDLKAQVGALISTSNKQSAASSTAPAPAASRAPLSAKAAAPDEASQAKDLLQSPAALKACLAAIGAKGEQPVAVDLARYAGREAAIIVLPADGGGYEVEVVARDCRPGNDGTIDVVDIPSS